VKRVEEERHFVRAVVISRQSSSAFKHGVPATYSFADLISLRN